MRVWPLGVGSRCHFKLKGANPASRRPRNIPDDTALDRERAQHGTKCRKHPVSCTHDPTWYVM